MVTFETAAEATRAKNQFDGILAKGTSFSSNPSKMRLMWFNWIGQPMEISYQAAPRPRRTTSAPSTLSLLSRIEKPPLLERLAKDDTATVSDKKCVPTLFSILAQIVIHFDPSNLLTCFVPFSNGKNQRGEGGRIGPIRGKTTRASKPKHPKKPKTAAQLDKELDAFMVDVSDPAASAPATAAATSGPAADVDMA